MTAQEDFDTLRSHARAMKTGVWASYADDVLDAVARTEDRLNLALSALREIRDSSMNPDKTPKYDAVSDNALLADSAIAEIEGEA